MNDRGVTFTVSSQAISLNICCSENAETFSKVIDFLFVRKVIKPFYNEYNCLDMK